MPSLRPSALVLAAAVLVGAAVARADEPADVDALIAVVRAKPTGMDEEIWKEKRRDAARQLGRLGDKKAVPVLIEVVEREQFDVVAEIAIESLGRLGDPRAIEVLRKVYGDPSRDQFVRDAAKTALRRLKVDPDAGSAEPLPDQGLPVPPPVGTPPPAGEPGNLLGDAARRNIPAGPALPTDTLAATEHLTLALGGASLQYDTVRDTPTLDADVAASYRRTRERPGIGYGFGAEAALAAGILQHGATDEQSTRQFLLSGLGDGEVRFYSWPKTWFGLIEGAVGASAFGTRIENNNPAEPDFEDLRLGADLHLGLGGGYGRVLDQGEALRLRRIERVLAAARLLGRPITQELARRIFLAWWGLRSEQGAQRRLLATVALLREGGVLLAEPDAGTTYELLQVLLDGQLAARPSGYELRLGVGESYLIRDDEAQLDEGRVETVFARARYGRQSADGKGEIAGSAFARYRVLAPDGEPSPWAAQAELAWRSYFYSGAWDPIGALEVIGRAGAAQDDIGDADADPLRATNLATELGAEVGWLWSPNRASQFRLAASISLIDGDEVFAGAVFAASYGLLDAAYSGNY